MQGLLLPGVVCEEIAAGCVLLCCLRHRCRQEAGVDAVFD